MPDVVEKGRIGADSINEQLGYIDKVISARAIDRKNIFLNRIVTGCA